MLHEICDNAKLVIQSTSAFAIRGHFHVMSYLRQAIVCDCLFSYRSNLQGPSFSGNKLFRNSLSISSFSHPRRFPV